jgi:hypothetical protein
MGGQLCDIRDTALNQSTNELVMIVQSGLIVEKTTREGVSHTTVNQIDFEHEVVDMWTEPGGEDILWNQHGGK